MEQAFSTILDKGVIGAVCIIALIAIYKLSALVQKNYEARLKEKDELISKLLDNELRTAQIIEVFHEIKPLFEEIRELLKRWYLTRSDL